MGLCSCRRPQPHLRCVGWWSGLTNCSTFQWPLTPKFIPETQKAKAHGWMNTLVLSLKWYHVHCYLFYEKRTTRAMVGPQGLHSSDTFGCCNLSSSVGLKSFCPCWFKLGGNTEMIATHLREVHYLLAITCDLCKWFTSMFVQSILEHHSGCKAKHAKEHVEQERSKAKKSHKKKSKVQEQEKAS